MVLLNLELISYLQTTMLALRDVFASYSSLLMVHDDAAQFFVLIIQDDAQNCIVAYITARLIFLIRDDF